MSFDTHCYCLAELFLPDDSPKFEINALAQHIQDAIEDYLSGLEKTQVAL